MVDLVATINDHLERFITADCHAMLAVDIEKVMAANGAVRLSLYRRKNITDPMGNGMLDVRKAGDWRLQNKVVYGK